MCFIEITGSTLVLCLLGYYVITVRKVIVIFVNNFLHRMQIFIAFTLIFYIK